MLAILTTSVVFFIGDVVLVSSSTSWLPVVSNYASISDSQLVTDFKSDIYHLTDWYFIKLAILDFCSTKHFPVRLYQNNNTTLVNNIKSEDSTDKLIDLKLPSHKSGIWYKCSSLKQWVISCKSKPLATSIDTWDYSCTVPPWILIH